MSAQERARAAGIVHAVVDRGRSLDAQLTDSDNGFVRALSYETLRWHTRLEALAMLLLDRRPRNRDIVLLRLIETGLAQLCFFDLPEHAAINETVAATGRLRQPRAKGLVNAVLRRFQREREALLSRLPQQAHMEFSFPPWLCERIVTDWPDEAPQLLSASNARAPMSLRINTRLSNPDKYQAQLQAAGIGASHHPHGGSALVLDQPVDVRELPGFDQGHASVQDVAAQLAGQLMQAIHRETSPLRVLDACAAPGGKTGHLAETLQDEDQLVALDNAEGRQRLTRDNLRRLNLNAAILVGDAATPDSWWDGRPFDGVLLDAPCSGTGVIRRHPDIKSLRRDSDIENLSNTQGRMLGSLWGVLKAGGLLIYSTCSVLKQENEQQVLRFLAEHADATDVTPEADWGRKRPAGRQILTGDDDMDGFYYAAIRKTNPRNH